jgi:YfiH family protein
VGERSLLERLSLEERIDPAARGRLSVRERAGLHVIEAALPGPFRTFFTTRLDGMSDAPYESLNLAVRSNDCADAVAANRERVRLAVGLSEGTLVSSQQVHGVRVMGAAEYVELSCGHDGINEEGVDGDQPCDGLTLHPLLDRGLIALLLFADCVPLVMIGDVDMAVVHGGWRGLIGGIVEQAGRMMTGPPGMAVVGPSLGPCCFTVGDDVADLFRCRFGASTVSENQVDLWAASATALTELGIREEAIVNPRLCTACNADLFYSYRREGSVTGRQGLAAWTEEAA